MLITNEVDAAVARLMDEFNDRMPAGSILRCLARSVHELRAAGVKAGLIVAAETMTRHRLERRLREPASVA
jgi:hypothetical protein